MKIKYFSYILMVDKENRHELDMYFDTYFVDMSYEVLGDVTEDDKIDEYGEIYDETVISEEQGYRIRFYVEERQVKSVEQKLKKKPDFIFVDTSEIYFEAEDFLNAFHDIINLTDNCFISTTADKGDETEDRMQIILEAKSAFGTGTHDSTKLAAILIEKYVIGESHVIDIGCGTGILAVLAAKRGAQHVLAVDQDPVAIAEAICVMENNDVADIVTLKQNNLIQGISIKEYNIIVANLSYQIYVKLFPQLFGKMNETQLCIFSGIMQKEKSTFEKLIAKYHGKIIEECETDDWCSFVVKLAKR